MADNDAYERKLKKYIEEHQIPAQHLAFTQSCHSVMEAAAAAGVTRQDFIKSICFITEEGALVVAIVKGEDRASSGRVARIYGTNTVRPANPEEMHHLTGYPCGGTPAFGYTAAFLIDERVLKTEIVYSGGGSENALVRMRSDDLQSANDARIVRIRS